MDWITIGLGVLSFVGFPLGGFLFPHLSPAFKLAAKGAEELAEVINETPLDNETFKELAIAKGKEKAQKLLDKHLPKDEKETKD